MAAAGIAVIGRRCLSPAAGLLAGLMYGCAVPVTRYAQEARSYAMVTAVAVLGTYLLVRGMRDDGRHPWRWFAGYGLAIVVLGLLNLNAVFLVPAHAVTLLTVSSKAAGTWIRWAVAAGLAAAALVPFALAAHGQEFQVEWLPEPSGKMVWTLVRFMAGGPGMVVPVLLLALVGAFTGFVTHETRPLTAVALPWLVVPPTLMLVASLLDEPLFMYRYAVFCLPALALLTGAGLARLASLGRPALGGIALAAAVAVVAVPSLPRHDAIRRQDSRPDDLRTPAEVLRSKAQDGDVLVHLAGVVRWGASAYPDAYRRPQDVGLRKTPVHAANLKGRDKYPRQLRRPLQAASRVWVMSSRSLGRPLAPPVKRRMEIIREMGPWRVAGTWKYRGGKLTLYVRTQPYRTSR
jgi:mannosyltransferase